MPTPSANELDEFIDQTLVAKFERWKTAESRRRTRHRIFSSVVLAIGLPATAALIFIPDANLLEISSLPLRLLVYPVISAAILGLLIYRFHRRLYARTRRFDYTRDLVQPLLSFIDPRHRFAADKSVRGRLSGFTLHFTQASPSTLQFTASFDDPPTVDDDPLKALQLLESPSRDIGPARLDLDKKSATLRIEGRRFFEAPTTQTTDAYTTSLHRLADVVCAAIDLFEKMTRKK